MASAIDLIGGSNGNEHRKPLQSHCTNCNIGEMFQRYVSSTNHMQSTRGRKCTSLIHNMKSSSRNVEEISVHGSIAEKHPKSFVPKNTRLCNLLLLRTLLPRLKSLGSFKSQAPRWLNCVNNLVILLVFILFCLTFSVFFISNKLSSWTCFSQKCAKKNSLTFELTSS